MKKSPWWGEYSFIEGQRWCWHIGDRAIIIQRHTSEWKIINIEVDEENNSPLLSQPCENTQFVDVDERDLSKAIIGRYLQKTTSTSINVLPMLADRPVIARPNHALHILPGEVIELYVSTPLWFRASTLSPDVTLIDVPYWRPSDSWFGPSRYEGEMCYAKYTDAKLQLTTLERRQHRAITSINIINHHKDILMIERLSIPVPLLNLYSDKDDQLWTQALTITRTNDKETVELDLAKTAPLHAINARHVNPPRNSNEKRTLIKSLSSLFA